MAKAPAQIKSLARAHTETAIRVLAGIMNQEEAPHAARVSAAQAILDRGWGKPTQLIAGDEDGAPINIVHGALETLGAKFDRILASSTAQGTAGQLN